jgi:hypothetical protein
VKNYAKMKIPEYFLHYLWEHRLCGSQFELEDGSWCRIIDPGKGGNRDGPDFEGVEIEFNGRRWLGFAEIHIKSSDWYRHFHHIDTLYEKTILHIVLENDRPVKNNAGLAIPTIVLCEADDLFRLWSSIQLAPKAPLLCHQHIGNIEPNILQDTITELAKVRLNRNVEKIESVFCESGNDLNETAWRIIARAYGISHNVAPMEWLARNVKWKQIAGLSSLFEVEALLFGVAGMLNGQKESIHSGKVFLQTEYFHLKNKFRLFEIEADIWKHSPVRPSSFPEIRLSQLAALVFHHRSLPGFLTQSANVREYVKAFQIPVSENGESNSCLITKSPTPKRLYPGKESINTFIINIVVPFLIFYSRITLNAEYSEKAIRLLEETDAEKNKIINTFVLEAKLNTKNALFTQGLTELYKNSCLQRKCMDCPILSEIMNTKNHERT